MSVIDKAKALGWKPAEGLPESQFLESAKLFLRNQPAEKVATVVAAPEAKQVDMLLLLTSPLLFARRDAKGKCLLEFSEKTCDAVAAKFENILVMTTAASAHIAEAAVRRCPQIRVAHVDPTNIKATMDTLTGLLKTLYNVHVRIPPGAQRTVSYLNIGRFAQGATVMQVGPDEHAKIGVEVDQELDFKAMVKIRSDNDWN